MALSNYRRRHLVPALTAGAVIGAGRAAGTVWQGAKRAGRMVRKWYNKRNPTVKLQRYRGLPLTGFPNSKMVRLRYCQVFALDPGAGAITSNVFSANGMFDVDVTGAGHQPLGFDQWMSIYDHYTVVGSKIKVRYLKTTAGALIPGIFGVMLDDNVTLTATTPVQIIEGNQPNSRYRLTTGIEGGNFGQPQVSLSFSAKKFFGTKSIISKAEYKGSSSANPTEGASYQVYYGSVDGSNNPGAATFLVTIEYIAVLTERKFLAQSS